MPKPETAEGEEPGTSQATQERCTACGTQTILSLSKDGVAALNFTFNPRASPSYKCRGYYLKTQPSLCRTSHPHLCVVSTGLQRFAQALRSHHLSFAAKQFSVGSMQSGETLSLGKLCPAQPGSLVVALGAETELLVLPSLGPSKPGFTGSQMLL